MKRSFIGCFGIFVIATFLGSCSSNNDVSNGNSGGGTSTAYVWSTDGGLKGSVAKVRG